MVFGSTRGEKEMKKNNVLEKLKESEIPAKLLKELEQIEDYSEIETPNHKLYWPNRLISEFISTLAKIYASDPQASTTLRPGNALAALFDLSVNLIYVSLVSDTGWIYCLGPDGTLPPSQYFSFVGACPRCTALGHYIPAIAHKPSSDTIGDASAISLALILRQVLERMSSDYKLAVIKKRQGDIDVLIYGPDLITLAEIKASPLVSYPLEVSLKQPLMQEDPQSGKIIPYPNHEKHTQRVVLEAPTIYLYIPHRDVRIDLGPRAEEGWPYNRLISWISNPDNLKTVVEAWTHLYRLYVQRDRQPAFFLTHGCGSIGSLKISDSKNAPGLDRTDDIKKGTYQVLKYGAYFGLSSEKRALKAALLSNIHPVVHFDEYLKELEDIVWTKEGMLREISPEEFFVSKKDVFYLYDAIICFTRNLFNNSILATLFDWETFGSKLAKEGAE